MKNYKIWMLKTILFSLVWASSNIKAEEVYHVEYPLTENLMDESLTLYPHLSWSAFDIMKNGDLKQGLVDGFLVVRETVDENGDKAYLYYLYRSKEAMKHRRLGSCIYLNLDDPKVVRGLEKNEKLEESAGRYCLITGLFKREHSFDSQLGYCLNVYSLHFASAESDKGDK